MKELYQRLWKVYCLFLLVFVICLPFLGLAGEQHCQSDRYHKMIKKLKLSEDSFSAVKYENRCDAEYFCVRATIQRPLEYKKYVLPIKAEMVICDYYRQNPDVNNVILSGNDKSFEVHDKLFCGGSFSFDRQGNFCDCTLAKPYTYLGYTFPAESIISMNENKIMRWVRVRKDFETKGQKLRAGSYNVNPESKKIMRIEGDVEEHGECGRD